mmetsp:Transcript_20172/g.63664  ORF Transcript_20172/g.63664 Transcript_20172/m.63664 type:complete len:283 (-) Transcript_20172:3359-4207(-)
MASSTAAGTPHCSTASLTACAQASTLSRLPSRASCKAARAALKTSPLIAARITPKGTARPFGAWKPPLQASASSFPEEAALAPAVCGDSAKSTACNTLSSARLRAPSLGAGSADFEGAANAPLPSTLTSSASLTNSTCTPPLASTLSRTALPSPAADRACSKSGISAVHANTTPNCRARKAKWLRTGRSRATTTPRQRGGSSSSPLASVQKIMAPMVGNSLDQASLKASQRTLMPVATPAEMAVQSGRPAAALALCNASCTSFETWNSTEARSSASTNTATA